MVRQNKIEFIVIKLHFYSFIDSWQPEILLTRFKRFPCVSMHGARDWIQEIINREKAKIPSGVDDVRFCSLDVKSGNADLFTVKGYRYSEVIVLLSGELVYWIFYTNAPSYKCLLGYHDLKLCYCGCCIRTQYLKIIETIKNWVKEE